MRLLFLSLMMLFVIPASAQQLSETEKINMLIVYVEKLDKVVLLRNGSEYTPAQAAKFFREKHKRNTDRVKTAKDFIAICASASSTTGNPYQVRFADGKVVNTQDLLVKELLRIEKACTK